LLAFYCDSCQDQVPCHYAKKLFDAVDYRQTGEIKGSDRHRILSDSIVALGDINGDGAVNFDEFKDKLEEYVRVVFKLMDVNNDGSIYEEASGGNIFQKISLTFFEAVLTHTIDFFDSNKDNEVSFDDSFFSDSARYGDRNEDGVYTLSEALHTPLINLPAPFYNLYTKLDQNQNDGLSRGEAMSFLRRTFSVIDSNSDCSIEETEVVSALAKVKLPSDQRLAVSLILKQYLTLGSFLVKEFTERADADSDGRVTEEEVLNFTDFDFIESMAPMVVDLGQPSGALLHLVGSSRYHRHSRDRDQEFMAMWLLSLQELLQQPEYSASIDSQCSTQDS